MKRLVILLLALGFAGGLQAAAEQTPPYQEGAHYKKVVPAQPTSTGPDKVEVIEFFSYACPHCYEFEPYIGRWLESKPEAAEYVRMPATFNPHYQLLARAFYAAESLGVLEQIHDALFREIHINRNPLNTQEALAAFFNRTAGVPVEDFNNAFNSFSVNTQVQRADVLGRRYRIPGVPALIVNGKYMPDNQAAGGYANLLNMVNFLVAKELAPLNKPAEQSAQ